MASAVTRVAKILLLMFYAWSPALAQSVEPEPGAAPSPPAIADQSDLPRVLLIGDSICQGYTPTVRARLRGQANIHYGGGGLTVQSLEAFPETLGRGDWAVIHFNWGLHDLKHWKDGEMDMSAPKVVPLEEYEQNLRELVRQMQSTGAKLIWATTTPVPEGVNGRVAGNELDYNAMALRVMEEEGVVVNDLHASVSETPSLQRVANVHFTEEGSIHLGEQVAAAILQQISIPTRNPSDKP